MVSAFANFEKVGYGLMNFTWVPSRKFTQEEFNTTIKKVIDGSKASPENRLFLNSGEFYGVPDRHENLQLIGGFFEAYPHYADKVYLSIKGGASATWSPDSSPENLTRTLEAIDKYLQPLYKGRSIYPKKLDMFTLCRVGQEPIEDTMKFLQKKADEGLFESICLSEMSANTLKRALSVGKVSAVEVEFSLFQHEPAENGVFEVCIEHGIPAVCYSPLGKGLLAGMKTSDLAKDDMRHNFDKFNDQEVAKNNQNLVDKVVDIAKETNLSPAQVALSWLTTLSSKTHNGVKYPILLPIPGSSNADRQLTNLNVVELNSDTMSKIDTFLESFQTAGSRYNKHADEFNYK